MNRSYVLFDAHKKKQNYKFSIIFGNFFCNFFVCKLLNYFFIKWIYKKIEIKYLYQQGYNYFINKMNLQIGEISKIIDEIKIIKIQKWFRGCIFRIKQLPLIMYKIKKYLKLQIFQFSTENRDGRINSCLDEDEVIKLLIENFGEKIKKPKIRMWYDILAFDYMYGWIPINIKTTTTLTSDNTGNLAMCVYAYTNETLDIHKSYENGKMSNILFNKLKNKDYNTNNKKDYYFIVLNKTNTNDIIVNSVKGLKILTPNINNLPFQVCWDKNRIFKYENINKKIKMFIDCLQKPKQSWKETFMSNIRTLKL